MDLSKRIPRVGKQEQIQVQIESSESREEETIMARGNRRSAPIRRRTFSSSRKAQAYGNRKLRSGFHADAYRHKGKTVVVSQRHKSGYVSSRNRGAMLKQRRTLKREGYKCPMPYRNRLNGRPVWTIKYKWNRRPKVRT